MSRWVERILEKALDEDASRGGPVLMIFAFGVGAIGTFLRTSLSRMSRALLDYGKRQGDQMADAA